MLFRMFVLFSAAVLAVAGCDTKEKIDTALDKASKMMDEVSGLVKALKDGATAAKKVATKAVSSLKPSARAKVPPLPPSVTGNVDITKATAGKEGTTTIDVDGDQTEDDVYVFVDERGILYEAWQDSEDGVAFCLLAWEKDSAVWVVMAECNASDGAWIGVFTADGDKWLACSAEGVCTTCPDAELCDWKDSVPTNNTNSTNSTNSTNPTNNTNATNSTNDTNNTNNTNATNAVNAIKEDCEMLCDAMAECELITTAEIADCTGDCTQAPDAEEMICLAEAAECAAMEACLPQ